MRNDTTQKFWLLGIKMCTCTKFWFPIINIFNCLNNILWPNSKMLMDILPSAGTTSATEVLVDSILNDQLPQSEAVVALGILSLSARPDVLIAKKLLVKLHVLNWMITETFSLARAFEHLHVPNFQLMTFAGSLLTFVCLCAKGFK